MRGSRWIVVVVALGGTGIVLLVADIRRRR
jgi:hypothetical protein